MQQRLVALHDRDVFSFLVRDQPGQVRPHGMEGVEGYHGAGQVHRFQQLGEMAGLFVLGAHLEMVQEMPAVIGDAEQVHPRAVGAAGTAGGLVVHGHGPQPTAGQHLGLPGGTPGAVAAYAGRGRPAAARTAAEQGTGQGSLVKTVQDHPDRLLIRCPVPIGQRVPRSVAYPHPSTVRFRPITHMPDKTG